MKSINWRYAIGEIVIVLIGISLAFALNNWKEGIGHERSKKQYLENLRSDIDKEISHLNEINDAISQKLSDIQLLRPHLGNTLPYRDTVISKVFSIAETVHFTPENSTYRTMINSGDLSLINDFQLRQGIQRNYNLHEEIQKNYERLENINAKYLGDFFIYHMNFESIREGDLSFMDDPLLMNIINSIQGAYFYILGANKKGLESNSQLMAMINEELSK